MGGVNCPPQHEIANCSPPPTTMEAEAGIYLLAEQKVPCKETGSQAMRVAPKGNPSRLMHRAFSFANGVLSVGILFLISVKMHGEIQGSVTRRGYTGFPVIGLGQPEYHGGDNGITFTKSRKESSNERFNTGKVNRIYRQSRHILVCGQVIVGDTRRKGDEVTVKEWPAISTCGNSKSGVEV